MTPGADLLAAWDEELAVRSGTFSLVLRSAHGTVTARDADVMHYAASTMKLAVLGALLADGTSGVVTVHDRFPSAVGGTFQLYRSDDQDDWTWARLGEELELGVLADRMITVSSNIATDLILERIGVEPVRRYLAAHHLDTVTVERMIGDTAAQAAGLTNTMSASALATLLETLAAEPRALALLERQTHLGMIPAGLPVGTWSASKGGWVTGVKHDAALVEPAEAPPYVLAVCTTSELSDAEGMDLVAHLSSITWEHWSRWHAS